MWTGAKNLALTSIRFPDRPSRSESLYRMRNAAQGNIPKYKPQTQLAAILI
jgi:hypothetical protein